MVVLFSVEIQVTVVCAAQDSVFKNHPKDILRDKNHVHRITLAHLSNIVFTTRKHFQAGGC